MPSNPNPIAVASIRSKTPIGSPLDTAGWDRVPLALRESAQFSATVERMRFLQRIQDRVTSAISMTRREGEGIDGGPGAYQTREKFIAELQRIGREEGLTPLDPARVGGLQDPTSFRRLDLIWNTQIEKAQEFAKWKMDQDPDVLNAYPAQEFIRVAARKAKRTDWPQRWKKAFGGRLPRGRYVALKTDPGWKKLSRFGTPWPPFDFGSGMGLRDISRRDAIKLGILKEGERVEPIEQEFNQELQASVKDLGPKMQSALKRIFGDQVDITDGVAKWNPRSSGPPIGPPPPPLIPRPAPPPSPPVVEPPLPVAPPPVAVPLPRPAPTPLAPTSTATRPPGTTGVSEKVEFKLKTQKEVVRYRETLATIDQVHGDGPLTPIPITNKIGRRSLATYWSTSDSASSIGVRNQGPFTEASLAHEVGHWIDHIGIDSPGSKFASESDSLPEIRPLMRAIRQSEAIKTISAGPASQYRTYLLSGRETFARSYAQFIAEQSQRPSLVASLVDKSERQWSTADFAPIRAEFQTLFRSLGWMK